MKRQDQLIQALLLFFEECLLEHITIEALAYQILYRGANGLWPLVCQISGNRFIFSSLLPLSVPKEKIQAVARYLHQANYALLVGGRFEFDEKAGEVRYTTCLDIAGGEVTTCMLFALYDAHRVADFHLQRLHQLILFAVCPAGPAPVFDQAEDEWLQQGDLLDLLDDIDVDGLTKGDAE